MRTTFNSLYRNTQRDLQRTANDFARAQHATSSGKKTQRVSENPADAALGLHARAGVRALDQYRKTADSAESRLLVVDTVLSDVIRTIESAQTRAAAGRTTVATPDQRAAIALEVEGLRDALFAAVNTSYRGIYVFGGSQTTAAPYTKVGTTVSPYQGDANTVSVDVSRTASVAVSVDGGAMLQGGAAQDLFATLDELAADIRNGNLTGIDARLGELDAAFHRVTQVQSRVGVTLSQLPAEQQRIDDLRRAGESRRAQAEDVNLAEAISEMTRAQQAYEAAIAATGNNQRLSLLNYLR